MNYVQIAQKAAHMTVALVVADRVESAVVDHTEIEEDSIPLQIGCMVAGQIVARHTDRITDPIVEKAAAKITSLKTKITKK
jgi:predicted TIM-barrel enzyme